MTNRERRNKNMAHIADANLFVDVDRARRLTHKLNTADTADYPALKAIVKELLGRCGDDATINPPFHCDYGSNIEVGSHFFANYNCTILDVAKVTIGDYCFIAPNVAIYTATHPIHPDSRNSMYECGKPVTIGDNCWIGGNSVILPGVNIGSNVVVGAGSVVTGDLPDWSLAAGNPCRVIRRITERDRRYFFKNEQFDDEAWRDIVTRGFGGGK